MGSRFTPVYVPAGDEASALRMVERMRVFVLAVSYPVVPRGVVLFGLTATAAYTGDDVDRTLEAFGRLREQLSLAPREAVPQSS